MSTWNNSLLVKPEQDKLVIVYTGSSVWYAYYDKEKDKWGDDQFSSDMRVTHWMDFPEPPKEA